MVRWLKAELERQRALNSEMRRVVADLARAFQESLALAYDAAQAGDLEEVRRVTIANRQAWQQYLQQIVQASKSPPPDQRDADSPDSM